MNARAIPDAMTRPTRSTSILFCPFCRESFEVERECPEHELRLVPFEALPREEDAEAFPSHDERVAAFDFRFGRGWVVAGILLLVVGFASPLVTLADAAQSRTFSGFGAAITRAPNLWTIPFVAGMFAWTLARRRTPLEMIGARLAGVVFACAPLFSLAYTALKVRQGAVQLAARGGQSLEVHPEVGVAVLAFGAFALLIGSLRFGVLPMGDGRVGRRLRPG